MTSTARMTEITRSRVQPPTDISHVRRGTATGVSAAGTRFSIVGKNANSKNASFILDQESDRSVAAQSRGADGGAACGSRARNNPAAAAGVYARIDEARWCIT